MLTVTYIPAALLKDSVGTTILFPYCAHGLQVVACASPKKYDFGKEGKTIESRITITN